MPRRLDPLIPLQDAQLGASAPRAHAALAASAGTGKTHVLTARVLRLLLSGVDPASILCLTFTKAGAAEMADRIHARLAHWVRLKDADLRKELFALGEANDPEALENARTLFARVLDAAGGGLRIQTIHAFAQALLAAFPAEAGLTPGFRPLEGREEQLLARATLADLLVSGEAAGDAALLRDVQALSHRLGEGGAEAYLMDCARAPDALAALGPREAIEPRLRRAFGVPDGDVEDAIAAACADDAFDLETVRRIAAANRNWGAATGLACCDVLAAWQAGDPGRRAATLDDLAGVVLKKDGEPRAITSGLLKADPDYAAHAQRLADCCRRLLVLRTAAALAATLAGGLRAGAAYADAYAAAKRAAGVVDFDDLIRWAVVLLETPGMGDWVRYKLDQATDHILVDEAQDTNARQWSIVRALTAEYMAGGGAVGRHRTIFTVGDFKQAIFGFQGTDPREFEAARRYFRDAAGALRDAAAELDEAALPPEFLDLSMDLSFRSSPPILAAVDRVIAGLGHDAFGLAERPNPHTSAYPRRPGSVTLWQPFTDESDQDEDAGEEGWISDTTRRYAAKLARQVSLWLANPFRIESKDRPLRPEDILILVRRRGTLASLIVARLHAEGVPVAGIDRLLLSAPLAVQDLLAAARFAAQPLDDLNLAALLVSPLLGWSQDDLYALAHNRPGALWHALRDGPATAASDQLGALLAMADYTSPHQFFETILSGSMRGRHKLLERLGPEALDPIEELLSGALQFEAQGAPSLQRFLDWFARGDVEVVRDPAGPRDAVRMITVHGAKGLQAPVVILADACVDPARSPRRTAKLLLAEGGAAIPVVRPRKEERVEPLAGQLDAQDARDREEHWRLLYVAMTRAEERLYVGGALGPADRNGPPSASWYAAIAAVLDGDWQDDPVWERARRLGDPETFTKAAASASRRAIEFPDWLRQPAPPEARPPRPLAPTAPGDDDIAYPPPGPAQRRAAQRGRLLHVLFERLPAVAPANRRNFADRWLERSAGIADAAGRDALIADAERIILDPAWAAMFAPDAIAEAPIAAVTADGVVVAGTIDRLRIDPVRVDFVDFKTGRAVPATLTEIPPSHLRQMAAYASALAAIFPDRPINASLLYTAGPTLYPLPAALLARHRPASTG